MTDRIEKIERLEKQRDELNARLQRERSRLSEARRKRETRRKILVGGVVMAKVAKGEAVNIGSVEALRQLMRSSLTRPNDLKLFEQDQEGSGDE